jgi:hypothetical protein
VQRFRFLRGDVRLADKDQIRQGTPTALRAAFAELVIALGPDRQEPEFLAEVLWSALHGMVVLVQSERIPATGAEVRLNVLVQKFSR